MNEEIVVDIHTHYYPKSLTNKLIELNMLQILGDKVILKWSNRKSLASLSLLDIESKLKELNRLNVHIYSVISIPNPWTYFMKKEEEVKIVRECNNELSYITSKYPEHLGAFATLPLNDPEASIEEAERAIKDLGLQGFVIGTGINGKIIADDVYTELLKYLEKLGKPIFIHPGTLIVSDNEDVMSVIVSFPFETTYAILKLIQKGYKLKIIAPHGGGFIPYQLGRINLLKDVFALMNFRPQDIILDQVYFDTVLYREEELNFLVSSVGLDRVLFGTDHPFSVSVPQLFLSLAKRFGKKILSENAIKLLGLKIPP
ncbi:amidohydrolase family protein [Sulfolobaceae archaeon RB850M]